MVITLLYLCNSPATALAYAEIISGKAHRLRRLRGSSLELAFSAKKSAIAWASFRSAAENFENRTSMSSATVMIVNLQKNMNRLLKVLFAGERAVSPVRQRRQDDQRNKRELHYRLQVVGPQPGHNAVQLSFEMQKRRGGPADGDRHGPIPDHQISACREHQLRFTGVSFHPGA